MPRPIVTSTLCLVLAAAGLSGLQTSAAGAASSGTPSLTASVAFGKASYVSGQTITATLTVRNTGTSTARDITPSLDSGNGDLDLDGNGLGSARTIPAGKSITIAVTGHPTDVTASTVTLSGYFYDRSGNSVATFSSSVPVKVREEEVTGEVFADANANGRPDHGEGLRGAKISFGYEQVNNVFKTTTKVGGTFQLTVPSAKYYVSGGTTRWKVIPRVVDVRPAHASFALRAVQPLTKKSLKAALHFTRSSYAPGQVVHTVITLTDTSSKVLRGIGAHCDGEGDPNELSNNRSWGSLSTSSTVTLTPHHATVFRVANRVPAGAQRLGSVFLACTFAYPDVDAGYQPTAGAWAKVPGQSGTLKGTVTYQKDGSSGPAVGLRNVKIALVDPTTCPVYLRRTTTDAHGDFRIGRVPAGFRYELYAFPPKGWKILHGNPTNAFVIGRETISFDLDAARGSGRTPKIPTKCA